jgi:Tol biopolymer transport system component
VAEAPVYHGRQLTHYTADDGQEIDQIAWTPDGRSLLFVRGGDFETLRDNPNPASLPEGVEQDIWIVSASRGMPRKLAEGNSPAVSPKGDHAAFLKKGEVWSIGLEENAKPAQLVHVKGQAAELRWSPDGSRLAFLTDRNDHAFIAVYNFDPPGLVYLDPGVDSM